MEEKAEIAIQHSDDAFFKVFLSDYSLRPSCYSCLFKGYRMPGDLIIGDFWNIRMAYPSMDDDKGVSEVIVVTEKGEKLISMLSGRMEIRRTSILKAFQPAIWYPPVKPRKRERFFLELRSNSFATSLQHINSNKLRGIASLFRGIVRTLWPIRFKRTAAGMSRVENDLKKTCIGCSACVSACPTKAIGMKADNEGFQYPIIDESKCINCGLCKRICPVANPKKMLTGFRAVYAMKASDEIRACCSSGGVFPVLAEEIVRKGGIVFGAVLDLLSSNFVKHTAVDDVARLSLLYGSKYIQSTIGSSYEDVKRELATGRLVLFSGTPCQIAGLYSYLGRFDYSNLYTISIICHGVPSSLVFSAYLKDMQKDGMDIVDVSFRDKIIGWRRYSIKLTYSKHNV